MAAKLAEATKFMSSYYNDINPDRCAVLRERIAEGRLPAGVVDCRDIRYVYGSDLKQFDQVHLFAGIGGFGIGFRDFSGARVLTGGFPCQPFSTAGRRQARSDDRYLWPEMSRIIQDCRPEFVIGENVAGLAHEFDWVLEDVLADLEAAGYETLPPLMVPACAFGAWHRRDRIWILAHLNESSRSAEQKQQQAQWPKELRRDAAVFTNPDSPRRTYVQGCETSAERSGNGAAMRGTWWDAEPAVGRMVHGVRTRLDAIRVESLGEAIVPQIAQFIAERIKAVMDSERAEISAGKGTLEGVGSKGNAD